MLFSQGFEEFLKMTEESAVEYEEYRNEYEKLKNSSTLNSENNDNSPSTNTKSSEGLCSVRRAIKYVVINFFDKITKNHINLNNFQKF